MGKSHLAGDRPQAVKILWGPVALDGQVFQGGTQVLSNGEAIAAYRKAIEVYPFYTDAYQELGQILVKQNKLDEAIAIYRKAIELEPKKDDIHFLLGTALMEKRKVPEAIAAFKQALKLDPNNPDVRQRLQQAQKQLAPAQEKKQQ